MRTDTFSSKYLQQDISRAGTDQAQRNWTLLLVFSVMGISSMAALGGVFYAATLALGKIAGLL